MVFKFREVDRPKIVQAAKRSLQKPEGQKALRYLKEERKLSDQIIDKFDFGFCPFDAPLCNYPYSELKGRIITPIYDAYGDLVALSTRHMKKDTPKRFLHESFDKGSYLYGLCYAKEYILKYKKAIIVEGEFDVAALHTVGLSVTVGVCGSAFTLLQASLLSRYAMDIYLVLDGDASGKRSIKRILSLYDKHHFGAYGIKYIPVYLPFGKDPDELIREKGKKYFTDILKTSKEEYDIGIN